MDHSPRAPAYAVLIAAAALVFASSMSMSCGDKSKHAGCKTDKECEGNKAGTICAENTCVECNTDAQCKDGKHCSAHACIAKAQCEHDDQCAPGQVCPGRHVQGVRDRRGLRPGRHVQRGHVRGPAQEMREGRRLRRRRGLQGRDVPQGFGADHPDGSCPLSTVYFKFDSSGIEQSERDRLDANNACINKAKAKNVFLIGHTDTSGTEEYNIALSERRAQAVADYMARLGSDPSRLQVVPKGETEPTGLGDDKDRRVEFQWH